MKIAVLACSAVLASSFVSAASAQDASAEFEAGRNEYLSACAACHGDTGDGNGPISSMFHTKIPDLRKLTASNDGVFPLLEVIQTIDGRAQIQAHGDPMPLFGNRYRADVQDLVGVYGTEQVVRARVLELALYIQSIQE